MIFFLLSLLCVYWNGIIAKERIYFIQVDEEIWDYAPKKNMIYSGDPKDTELYLNLDKDIPLPGTKYKKAMYRSYTDATFTKRHDVPPWQGMLGPLLRGEVGDTIIVHFQNNASHNCTIHPHGVFYNKDSEGAMYADGSSPQFKLDDAVPPGGNYTYVWSVRPEYGPEDSDPDCIAWLAHSHDVAEIEVMTGAIMIYATCKKGVLDENGNLKGAKEFSLLFAILDENFSYYRNENREAAGVSPEKLSENFPVWQMANQKHSINGYIYGNLPGLEVCEGDKVVFYIAVIGNDYDLHTVYVQGQTMEILRQTTTTVGLYPGSSKTATIEYANEGKWILSCQARDYIKAGMQAYFTVKKCGNNTKSNYNHGPQRPKGTVRNYYIAAEEHTWNYAPSGIEPITGERLIDIAPQTYRESPAGGCRFNGTYKKVFYRGYTNRNFRRPLRRRGNDRHLGFLGPVISAEVGDTVNVLFWNRATRPYSIQINRYYGKENQQGTQYKDGPNVAVEPNKTRTYSWTVPQSVAPTKYDSDCVLGRYYSAVDQVKDTFSGLSGPILICKKGKLNCKNKKIYDKMFYLSFSNIAETESHYFEENVKQACDSDADPAELIQNRPFVVANTIRSINGYAYGNLPGLQMQQGDKVAWFVMSVGNIFAADIHTPYFHGNTFLVDGMRGDTFPLIPDLYKTLYMIPDNPGTWLIVDETHIINTEQGMHALYTVTKNKNQTKPRVSPGKTRTYYIAAVEIEWNYVPDIEVNPISGVKLSEDEIASITYNQGDTRIGHIYTKAVYREFTDETFTTEKEREDDTKHLGVLGPYIKAEVGDTIRVVFKNMARFHFSIQAHGVFYDKENEGQFYENGNNSTSKPGDSVAPNDTFTYEWLVPARAGPSKKDSKCILWIYKSAVNDYSDGCAGLIGPMIICEPGMLDATGHRKDANREFVLFLNLYNENGSPYLRENIRRYAGKPEETFPLIDTNFKFFESNIVMTVNGYQWASIRHVSLLLGERAIFYLFSWGDSTATHTAHFHGNTFRRLFEGLYFRHDVMDILPSQFTQIELVGVNAGDWLMHCHVNNHSENGMLMTYQVIDPDRLYHPVKTEL